jgi:hypothetical protein
VVGLLDGKNNMAAIGMHCALDNLDTNFICKVKTLVHTEEGEQFFLILQCSRPFRRNERGFAVYRSQANHYMLAHAVDARNRSETAQNTAPECKLSFQDSFPELFHTDAVGTGSDSVAGRNRFSPVISSPRSREFHVTSEQDTLPASALNLKTAAGRYYNDRTSELSEPSCLDITLSPPVQGLTLFTSNGSKPRSKA